MAIARVHTAKAGVVGGSSTTINLPAFAATTGNTIVVFGRDWGLGSLPSAVTDTAGNTYTLEASDASHDPFLAVFVAKNIAGHASNVVSLSFPVILTYGWGYAIEYSGVDTTTPVDIKGANPQGAATDCVSTAFATAQASEVVVMAASQGGFCTFTAGTNFTLVDGSIGASGNNFGGVEEYFTSGTLSSYTAHITSSASLQYTTVWVALKAAGGGSPSVSPVTYYAMQRRSR